jgi:hypothetical protein
MTAQTPQAQQAAAAAPRAAPTSRPVPTQNENDQFALAQMYNAIPRGYIFAADGSPIDPQSFSPVQPTPPTWP